MFSDVVGQVGNELGTLGEIVAPDRIDLQSDWDAGQPRQRPVIGCRSLRKSPVKDGGHVASGGEVTAKGSIVEVAERVVARFGGEVEEMGSQGGPGRFAGEPGNVLVDLVEVGNNLGSEEVFGGGVKAVGVPLDSVEQPGSRITELTQQVVVAEVSESSRARICCKVSVGVRGATMSGRMTAVGVAVADDLKVEVVGVPAAGEHRVQLLPGLLPGHQAVHGVGGDALCRMNSGGVAETGRGCGHSRWAAGR